MRRFIILTIAILPFSSAVVYSQGLPPAVTPVATSTVSATPNSSSSMLPAYPASGVYPSTSPGSPTQVSQVVYELQPLPPVGLGAAYTPAETMPTPAPELIAVPEVEVRPKIWEGGLELGLDGSEGNSQTFNLHLGAKLKRKTDLNILSCELDYKKNTADSIETANKAFLDSRFEHLFQQSRWTWFVHNVEDYDEFKAYDLRVSLDTGLGYQLIKNDRTLLTGRFGGGTTWEIDGPQDECIPEAVFGLEGEHKLSKRQKLTASVEYRPDVTEFSNYRIDTKAAWEVLLDEERNLSMKISILDRYDSYVDGHEPNDLDYAVTLLWSF